MSILKIKKRSNPFVQVDKGLLFDSRLSLKAKGLLCHLLARPDGWEVKVREVANHSSDGERSIYSALKELKHCGYAAIEDERTNGRISARKWIIQEVPLGQEIQKPSCRKPSCRKRQSTFRSSSNIEESNKEGNLKTAGTSVPADTGKFFGADSEWPIFIKKATAKLEKYIREKCQMKNKQIHRPKWYKQMSLLVNDTGGDKNRVKQVLMAYTKNEHDKYTPTVRSAYEFRDKFVLIEQWANRNGLLEAANHQPKIKKKLITMSEAEYQELMDKQEMDRQ